jgi:hypothetical protein
MEIGMEPNATSAVFDSGQIAAAQPAPDACLIKKLIP